MKKIYTYSVWLDTICKHLTVALMMLFCRTIMCIEQNSPQVTLIVVVDQLAYHYIKNIGMHFKDGLRLLTTEGINYINAYMPHGMPATATGHAGLSTGTYAKDHGIIGNRWFDGVGTEVRADTDPHCKVFVEGKPCGAGKSSHRLMVDTLSDQFMLASTEDQPRYAYSISLKSRAAVFTSGKLGKAVWFDPRVGLFTSSTAYYDALPRWLTTFNIVAQQVVTANKPWQLRFSADNEAYARANQLTYDFVVSKHSLIGINPEHVYRGEQTPTTVDSSSTLDLSFFVRTPYANQLLLDCVRACIESHPSTDHLLVWICVSSTDQLGHDYGPDSIELVDMIYHLDKQLGDLFDFAFAQYGKEKCMLCLTADHGIIPLVELLQNKKLSLARRVHSQSYIAGMNERIAQETGIQGLVVSYKAPQYFLNMVKFSQLDQDTRRKAIHSIKKFLLEQPGIKSVWTAPELYKLSFKETDIENFFKQQLFPGRSGYIVVQTFPYSIDSKWNIGTDHRTPYDYDTHIPLILYQPTVREKKRVKEKVFALQLANTLADILDVARPSASTFDPLPYAE